MPLLDGSWVTKPSGVGDDYQRSTFDAAKEVGRQLVGGVAVDLPRLAGQGMRWVSKPGSQGDIDGRAMVDAADQRAEGYEPHEAGSGMVGRTLASGARMVGPSIPVIAASMLPGIGEVAGPAVAGAAFGASAAQDTKDKVQLAGGSDEDSTRAGYLAGAIQGPAMMVGSHFGAAAFRGAASAIAAPTMDSVIESLTSGVAKNAAKGIGTALAVEPAVNVGAQLGTEMVDRSYGVAPTDMLGIAKGAAQGAVGLTALLGPLALGAHIKTARQGRALASALSDPTAPLEARTMAEQIVAKRALDAGVPQEQVDAWTASRADAGKTPIAPGTDMLTGKDTAPPAATDTPPAAEETPPANPVAQEAQTQVAPQADEQLPAQAPTEQAPAQVDPAVAARAAAPAAAGVHPDIAAAQAQQADAHRAAQQAAAEQQSRVEQVKAKIAADQAARADAENVLGGAEVDAKGKRVNKVPGRYADTYLELKSLHDEQKITPQQFSDATDRLIASLQMNDAKSFQSVRKDIDALRNPTAPEAPKTITPEKAMETPAPAPEGHTANQPAAEIGVPLPVPAPPAPVVKVEPVVKEPPETAKPAVKEPPAATAAPAAPKPFNPAPRRVPKAEAAAPAPVAAPKPVEAAAPAAKVAKFDNEPELADAIAKENAWPQAVSDAWMRSKVLGESHTTIAADLGVGKSTVGDFVRKMDPLMEAAKPTRLERNAETERVKETPDLRMPENQKEVEESGDEHAPAAKAEEHEGDISDLDENIAALDTHDLKDSGDLADEDNQVQGQEDRQDERDSSVNITDSPHGEGKTSANNNIEKGRSAQLDKAWTQLNMRQPADKRVAWKDLGSAQQDAFDAESAKGDKRAASAHASISESARSGARYMEADRIAAMIVNGADGKINGAAHLTTPDEMLGRVGEFPVLDALRQQKSTQGITYGRPDAYELPVIAAAYHIVANSAASKMFGITNRLVQRIGTFMAQTEGQMSTGAAFIPADRAIAFNSSFIPDAGQWHKPPMAMVQMVVHEHVHAIDNVAGKLHSGDTIEASSLPGSPTLVYVDIDFHGDKVNLQLGAVVQEALDAYTRNTEKFSDFDQALGSLMLGKIALDTVDYKISGLDKERGLKAIEAIADRATAETTPKLMEMYLASPEWLKANLPRGFDHAEALAKAETIKQATAILGGLDVGFQSQKSGSLELAPQVRGPVRAHAASGEDAVAGRVPRAGGEVAEDGRAGARADAATEGPVRASELKSLPAAISSAGIKDYAKSITEEGGKLAKLYRTFPQLLGALSTEQLAERFREHPLVQKFSDASQRMGGLSNHLIGEANVIIRDWEKANKGAGKAKTDSFGKLILDADRAGMWPNKAFDDKSHDYLKPATPTDKSTPAEKARYDERMAELEAKHKELAAAWAATSKAHQDLYLPILKQNADNFDRHIAADRKSIIDSFAPGLEEKGMPSKELIQKAAAIDAKPAREAFLKENALTTDATQRFNDLWDAVDSHKSDYDNKRQGPYFPRTRFGDHIVSYKSEDYAKAEAAHETARKALSELNTGALSAERANVDADVAGLRRKIARATSEESIARHEADLQEALAHQAVLQKPVDEAKALFQKRTNDLNDMKANDSHYAVEFHENRETAIQRVAQLKEFFGDDGTSVTRSTRDQYLLRTDGTTPAYMNRIADHLAGAMTGAQAEEIRRTVREMHIQNLPGSSALKNQLKRKNVPGVKAEEALRSFAAKSIKDAYAISRKTFSSELHEHMSALRYDESSEDAKILGNELAKRMALNMSGQSKSKLLSSMTNWTYFAQLGMSPGFMLQQATQTWINTAPMMAARHGVGTTTRLLGKATIDAGKLLKTSFDNSKSKMSFAVDIPGAIKAGLITEHEGAMLKDMFDRGRIDIASSHDAGIAETGQAPGLLQHAALISNWPVQQLEVMNRVQTALAGFRAELAKSVKGGAAMEKARADALRYADQLVSETHMNYASENRARFIHPNSWGGWGRIMFQFRAYQQGMVYLTLKNVIDGVRGNTEALKAAGYMAGVQFGTGGLAGMPMTASMLAIGHLLYSAFANDDEDRDLKEAMYQGIKSVGGSGMADLITKGVPAALGVDVSEKVGSGHIFDPAPFVRNQKDGRDLTAAYFMSLVGGAAGGQVANVAEALHQAAQGNYAKAAILAIPKTASDLLKSEEYQRKGLIDSRGNTILSPDEITTASSVIRALGLSPTEIGQVQDERAAMFTARTARNDARAKLLQEYARAKIAGDDTSETLEKIAGFNERHSDDRIHMGALPVAVQKAREQARNMKNGVPVGKRDKQLYSDVIEE